MSYRVACIFLFVLTCYMAVAITSLAFENLTLRKTLMACAKAK